MPLKFAFRELRGGLGGFRIFMACLILGVTAIAAVGSLTQAIEDSLTREGRTILSGDFEVRRFQRELSPEVQADVAALGSLSVSARLRTMARVADTGKSTLVELRAVDSLYPHYGTLETRPQLSNPDLLDKIGDVYGVAIDETLAAQLGVERGDQLVFGAVTTEIRAFVTLEPDKANQGLQLGPSVFVRLEALTESGLVTTGSLINHYYKLKVAEGTPLEETKESLKTILDEALLDQSYRLRDRTTSAPGLRRFIEQMGSFLVIVGLASLVVGGVGVGNAVKGYMDRKTRTIATLKILGATGRTVFITYFAQVMLIGLVSTIIGLALGAVLPGILGDFLPADVPVQIQVAVYPSALVLAGAYGLLITIAFTVWPLGRARDLPAVRLFRALVAPEGGLPRRSYLAMITAAALGVTGLAIGLATSPLLAASFLGGAALCFLILRGLGWLIEKGAANLPRPKGALRRMALANLHRPGAATSTVVISLGLGLTLFATLSLIEGNLSGQLDDQIPNEAPAFFFVDIQPYQLEQFREKALSVEGARDLVTVPSLRGTITMINETPAADYEPPSKDERWILRGDRGLSYGLAARANSELVQGSWWPDDYDGPPQISFGREEAEGLGLKLGDRLTVNVLGRDITAEIVSLRDIGWQSFGFNFVILFDPKTLAAAPHTYMATLKASGAAEQEAHAVLTRDFPGVTAVRIKDILSRVNSLLTQVSGAVTSTSLVAIVAGILVLAGAIAAGFRERVYESVIMKVVGAVRRQILMAYALEYLLIGLITATVALGLGLIAGYLVIEFVMQGDFVPLPGTMLTTVSVALGATVAFGLSSSWRALSAKPNAVLRTE